MWKFSRHFCFVQISTGLLRLVDVVGTRLSLETMESVPRFREWVIELQRLLWLYNPILHRQALLTVAADEFRVWLGGYGYDAALSRQRSLLSSRCSALLSSHA